MGVQNQRRLMSGWSVMDANLVDEIRRIRLDTWRHFESMASDISVANLAQAISSIQASYSLNSLATEITFHLGGRTVGDFA